MTDINIEVFVMKRPEPQGDAVIPVACETCDDVWFTSQENLNAVRARKMKVICLLCALSLGDDEEDIVVVAGEVKDGKIIDRETDA